MEKFLNIYFRHPYVDNPEGLPERTNEVAGEYARACIAVATECQIPVIDLWTKMQQFPDWRKDYLRFLKISTFFVYLCLQYFGLVVNLALIYISVIFPENYDCTVSTILMNDMDLLSTYKCFSCLLACKQLLMEVCDMVIYLVLI